MTLTKYQQGVTMEGWNDCPPIMLPRLNLSSASLNSGSRKGSVNVASDNHESMTTVTDDDINLSLIIDEILQYPTKLSDKMGKQIKEKLMANVGNMEPYKRFIFDISHQLRQGTDSTTLKQQMVEFMMINDGVSSWCAALKKTIESIQL